LPTGRFVADAGSDLQSVRQTVKKITPMLRLLEFDGAGAFTFSGSAKDILYVI
jgi:hypothetical protein